MSFPFRLGPTGAIASVEQGSDTWIDECVAQAVLTRSGERIQVPTFGISDPVFATFAVGSLQRHLSDFGPPVTITGVKVTNPQEGTENVVVSWRRSSDEINPQVVAR
jgi:hypothetical protein